ncbi:nuclease SbcCD subunit C [Robertmurraya siralis]|uniref:Nuclease SbcCD subunit C n=1 Tax=Robertmurraya siralis TaxID=77777 RepID=A0A920BTX9_9BACI|nr:AAA family ATPase [Robertmurraya siralis]GIN61717.1 nuclease SbcCD subunit C [Robertmurraya siralis]
MRPITLTMQAFGPYAGRETIDFSELENRTMFVISGKTGSGKTTIFDGISYAIYGKASGEDRNGSELRSQFARDDLHTEVALKFSLRGKQYFVKRSPQQEKKKERGDGYRTVGASAELYIFDQYGEQQLVAANVRDVDEKIKEIMLIDSNQFRQILMIPQGEFRKLLTSDSKEKEVILQRLFHTEMYKRIEEKLKQEAIELKRNVENQQEERALLIRKISAIYNEELKRYLEAGSDQDVLIFPLLETEIEKMAEQLEKIKNEVKEKEKDKELFAQKLYEAENIVKQMETREQLAVRKKALEINKEMFVRKEKEIVQANKAALLAKQDELCHRLKKERDALIENVKLRAKNLEDLHALLQKHEEIWKNELAKEDERKKVQEEIHSLQQMKDEVTSFALLQKEVMQMQQNRAKRLEQQQQLEETFCLTEKALGKLLKEKNSIEKIDVQILENRRNFDKLEQELALAAKYGQQVQKNKENAISLEKSHKMLAQAQARLDDAKALVHDLENKWLHGQAAALANQLHTGEACPVCGSTEHPQPASQHAEFVPDENDLKAAKEQVAVLEQERLQLESAFLEKQSRMKTGSELLQEISQDLIKLRADFTEDKLESYNHDLLDRKRILQKEYQQLIELEKKYKQISAEVAKLEEKKNLLEQQISDVKGQVNDAAIRFTEKNTQLNGLMSRIPVELRSTEAFERKWLKAVRTQESLLQQFEATQRHFQETKEKYFSAQSAFETVQKHAKEKETELNVERAAFIKQLKEQDFKDYKQFEYAKRSTEEIALLEKEIRHYYEELRSVSDRYQELVETLRGIDKPNLQELQQKVHEVQEIIAELNTQYTNLFIKKNENEQIRALIVRINAEMKELEKRYKLVGELYDITRGQNAAKITFERYVLAAFLDDILREANSRLLKMTSGRYQMLRKKERAKGNVQSGLELLVFDQYTGQERHVKTLSGGESFKAALSLALGLADVVQNYAGGVSLETMFIDEGFGTLDPESLDQAIEALIDIQSSGRLVGIISHVPELRERIDARLEVTGTQTGSTTNFYFLN